MMIFQRPLFLHMSSDPESGIALACFQSFEMGSRGLRETGKLLGLMRKSFLRDFEANFALSYYTHF